MAVVSRTQQSGSDVGAGDGRIVDAARLPGTQPELAVDWNNTAQFKTRALLLWPGLDRARLGATGGDPLRIARLVERRTRLPIETILAMLGVRASSGRPPSLGAAVRRTGSRRQGAGVPRDGGEPGS